MNTTPNNEENDTDRVQEEVAVVNGGKLLHKRDIVGGSDYWSTWNALCQVLNAVHNTSRPMTNREKEIYQSIINNADGSNDKYHIVPAGTIEVDGIVITNEDLVVDQTGSRCKHGSVLLESDDNVITIKHEDDEGLVTVTVNGVSADADLYAEQVVPKLQDIMWRLVLSEAKKEDQREQKVSNITNQQKMNLDNALREF